MNRKYRLAISRMMVVLLVLIQSLSPAISGFLFNLQTVNAENMATDNVTPTVTATPMATPTTTPELTLTPDVTLLPSETPIPTDIPEVTETPVTTVTPVITETIIPTETPVITDTPILTPVIVPSPTPTPTIGIDGQVVCHGDLKVSKLIDFNGNGTYNSTNEQANSAGFGWGLAANQTDNAFGNTLSLSFASYNIYEQQVPGYHFTGWYDAAKSGYSCTNPQGTSYPVSVDIAYVDWQIHTTNIVLCNAHDTGTLKVQKTVDDNSALNLWSFKLDAGNPVQTDNNGIVDFGTQPTGAHVISEFGPAGYKLASVSGTNCGINTDNSSQVNANIQKNQQTMCTVNNVSKASLTIIKQTEPQSFQKFIFKMSQNGQGNQTFELRDNGSKTFNALVPGKYSIQEQRNDDWYFSNVICNKGTQTVYSSQTDNVASIILTPGDHVSCTYTNTKAGSISAWKFEDSNANGAWDLGEFPLRDWQMQLFTGNDCVTANILGNQKTTSFLGLAYFDHLQPGNYSIKESGFDTFTDWVNVTPVCQNILVTAGAIAKVVFGNFEKTAISGIKYADNNGNGHKDRSELGVPGWTISLYKWQNEGWSFVSSTITGNQGKYMFTDLGPGKYKVMEESRAGWKTNSPVSGYYDNISLRSGKSADNYDFGNYQSGTIHIFKFNDLNGNGTRQDGEPTMSGWTVKLTGISDNTVSLSATTNQNGEIIFNNLAIGNFAISEVQKSGWAKTGISCDPQVKYTVDSEVTDTLEPMTTSVSGYPVMVTAGANINCYIGNMQLLTISKSNNSSGSLLPGNQVVFSITLSYNQYATTNLDNVQMTDLFSQGFTYVPGSWHASIPGVPEPTYHSPGVWSIGQLTPGQNVTLSYIAAVNSDTDPGVYKDLSWAQGTNSDGQVLALNSSANNYFVGTAVNVSQATAYTAQAVDLNSSMAETLPRTGMDLGMLIWTALIALGGTMLAGTGLFMSKFKLKKTVLGVILLGMFVTGATVSQPVKALALDPAPITVSVEQPQTPTNQNGFDLAFVALDLTGNPITVNCLSQGPGAASFNIFQSLAFSNAGGNTGKCTITSAMLPVDGDYRYYVTASSASGTATSGIMSVTVDRGYPTTPVKYTKVKIDDCSYQLGFSSAVDGNTIAIDIFRSPNTFFYANSSTLIKSINIAPGKDLVYTDTIPVCGQTYYYVVQAVTRTGNRSGFIGDQVVTVITATPTATVTTTSTPTSTVTATGLNGSVTPDVSATSGQPGVLGQTDNTTGSSPFNFGIFLIIVAVGAALLAVGSYVVTRKK